MKVSLYLSPEQIAENKRVNSISATKAYNWLQQINAYKDAGYDDKAIDEALQKQKGFSVSDLNARLSNLNGHLAQGMTLGLSDEAGGAMDAINKYLSGDPGSFSENYTKARDANRSDLEAVHAAHPNLSTAAEIIGGLPVAATGAGLAGEGAGILGTLGRQAVAGGALGAASGYGHSDADSLELQLKDTAKGGAWGALAGAAGSAVGAGAGRLINAFASPLSKAAQALAKTNVNPDDVIAAIKAGKLPVDVSEEASNFATQNLARTGDVAAARAPIVNRDPVTPVYDALHAARFPNDPVQSPVQYKAAADAAFDSARNNLVPASPDLQSVLRIPAVKKAYDAALGTLTSAERNAINTSKQIPVEVLEMTRQNVNSFLPDSMGAKATELGQTLVAKSGSKEWQDAIAASQRHLQSAEMHSSIPPLMDAKLPDKALVAGANKALGVQDPAQPLPAGLQDAIRGQQPVQRSIDAAQSASAAARTAEATKDPASSVASNTVQAGVLATNHPVIAANKVVQAIRGLMPAHHDVAAEIAKLMSNDDLNVWNEIAKNLPAFARNKAVGRTVGAGILSSINDESRR